MRFSLPASIPSCGVLTHETPVRAPTANAYCERLVGTIRRECLDFLIPLSEAHLKRILDEFVRPLQSGMATLLFGTWNPGPDQSQDSGRFTPTQAPCRALRQIDTSSWRAASRVWIGEAGSLATDRIFAEHSDGGLAGNSARQRKRLVRWPQQTTFDGKSPCRTCRKNAR
jgi:hypothetical protein